MHRQVSPVLGLMSFVLAVVVPATAKADVSLFHRQPDWLAAVGGASAGTVLHFDGSTEANGLPANDPAISPSYASLGVVFLPFTGTSVFPAIARGQGFQIPDPARDGLLANNPSPNPVTDLDGRAIRFDFAIPAKSVGVFTNRAQGGDGGYLEAFDAAMASIGKVDLAPGVFGGILSDRVIARASIVNTFDDDIRFGIWDLQFSQNGLPPIPEPSTFAFMTLGLGLLGFVAHRRRGGVSAGRG